VVLAINFRGGPPKGPSSRPTDPIKIFQARPALDSQVSDLWRGQARALDDWYKSDESDILISLNTGAGKSIIGGLICQSWLNAGVDNPVYLCATNDLVDQTAAEAAKLALKFTTRKEREYSNDLFEGGQGFLITSYQTLFNAKSVLRGSLAPGAVLFDDAHVGEPIIRGQYTLVLRKDKYPQIRSAILEIIERNLTANDRQRLRLVLNATASGDAYLCPPETGALLTELLTSLSDKFADDPQTYFPYLQLVTHFDACAVLVRTDDIEFSPPFLPTRTHAVMTRAGVKRVYLSATLKAESEFIRAYGKRPDLIIEPEVDAGNGERTVLNAKKLVDRDQLVVWAQARAQSGKILIATPSKGKAKVWETVARPPETSKFNAELGAFRKAQRGAFLLAGRFDGIDLPDATCRLMIVAGLPTGGSGLETYIWQVLEMQNLLAARVATRITQLFGRIIRGRNDYGLFIVQGGDLQNWLSRDRNLALLPELLQKQVKLGETLNEEFEISKLSIVTEFLNQVLEREEGWLEYYRGYVDDLELDTRDVEKRSENEKVQRMSALAEARFAEAFWQHRYSDAAITVEDKIDEIANQDSKLAGWLNVWAGACRGLAGSRELASEHYRIAKSRLQLHMDLPIEAPEDEDQAGDATYSGEAALRAMAYARSRTFSAEARKARNNATVVSSRAGAPSACEEAYRALGAFLGYRASRPDEEVGSGPDVLWIDELQKAALSFELKTDKGDGAELSKRDIGQSHNHIQWVMDNCPGIELKQHYIVGRSLNVAANANPDPRWAHSEPMELLKVVEAFCAEAQRVRNLGGDAKRAEIQRLAQDGTWSIEDVAKMLTTRSF
jgi:hypothetical protein